MDRLALSDAQWDRISGLIIGRSDQRGSTGRDNRMFVEGVLWIVRTGSPWRDLPEAFGEWNSVFRRFSRWSAKGIWLRMFEALADDLDFEYLIVDSTIVRAHQHASGAKGWAQNQAIGRSRGGLTTKIHMAVRGLGCPVRFFLTAGQAGDAPQAQPLVEGLVADFVNGGCSLRFRCLPNRHRSKRRTSRHSKQSLAGTEISAQQAHLRRASSRRVLLLKAQAIQTTRCNALRKDREKLLRRRHYRCDPALAKVNVHTT